MKTFLPKSYLGSRLKSFIALTLIGLLLNLPAKAQIILWGQDFDTNTNWDYTTTGSTPNSVNGAGSTLPVPVILSPGNSLNHTIGGVNGFYHFAKCCNTSTTGMATTNLHFAPVNIAGYPADIEISFAAVELQGENASSTSGICYTTAGSISGLIGDELDHFYGCPDNSSGGTGNGMDSGDSLRLFMSVDGGPEVPVLRYNGFSNKLWTYASGTQYTYTGTSIDLSGSSAYSVGKIMISNVIANTVALRVRLRSNRRHEVWAVDNVYAKIPAPLSQTGLQLFASENIKGESILKWKDDTQQATTQYIIQVSKDGKDFQDLATLKPDAHQFTLTEPFTQYAYYRIGSVTDNQTVIYSNVISLRKNDNKVQKLRFYPNPAESTIYLLSEEMVNLIAIDVAGKELPLTRVAPNTFDTTPLPQGLYYLKGTSAKGNTYVEKLLKK